MWSIFCGSFREVVGLIKIQNNVPKVKLFLFSNLNVNSFLIKDLLFSSYVKHVTLKIFLFGIFKQIKKFYTKIAIVSMLSVLRFLKSKLSNFLDNKIQDLEFGIFYPKPNF